MKNKLPLLAFVALACSSCFTASIFTYVPESTKPTTVISTQPVATTTVYRSGSTTTVKVLSNDTWDVSYYLDLNAIGAAFAQSYNVREFEMLINNSQYMLTNLDLDRDGYIDYLRVMETYMGSTHVLLIQAVLGVNYFQDVATIIAECTPGRTYVQVIGSPYIYGKSYIVEPVFVKTPPVYAYWNQYGNKYTTYISPYSWDHYPSCYRRTAPVYISHYQAYVSNYMQHHTYCHEAKPVPEPRYQDYGRLTQSVQRNDYANRYPEREFSTRTDSGVRGTAVSGNPTSASSNARDLVSPTVERRTEQNDRLIPTAPRSATTAAATKQPSANTTQAQQATRPATTTQTRMTRSGSASTQTTQVDSRGNTTTTSNATTTTSSSLRQTRTVTR